MMTYNYVLNAMLNLQKFKAMSNENFYLDMNGTPIEAFDEVEVPEPNDSDLHNIDFTGMVDGFRNGNVLVVDGDCNIFEIEPERLEVLK